MIVASAPKVPSVAERQMLFGEIAAILDGMKSLSPEDIGKLTPAINQQLAAYDRRVAVEPSGKYRMYSIPVSPRH